MFWRIMFYSMGAKVYSCMYGCNNFNILADCWYNALWKKLWCCIWTNYCYPIRYGI